MFRFCQPAQVLHVALSHLCHSSFVIHHQCVVRLPDWLIFFCSNFTVDLNQCCLFIQTIRPLYCCYFGCCVCCVHPWDCVDQHLHECHINSLQFSRKVCDISAHEFALCFMKSQRDLWDKCVSFNQFFWLLPSICFLLVKILLILFLKT